MVWKSGLIIAPALFLLPTFSYGKLTWGGTKYLFVFGDSYTTTGFNISNGVDSPTPGWTSSNGPNWVSYLTDTYNVGGTKVLNLASGGATVDAALVPPYLPYPRVLSIVDQVSQFQSILAPRPTGAAWNSNDSLFAFWIGINDIGQSFGWDNITRPEFYPVIMDRLTSQIDLLYSSGARSFLFLTVPPIDRAPLFIEQGKNSTKTLASYVTLYNNLLTKTVKKFSARHRDLDQVTIFDTRPVFNTLLDNDRLFGYANATGYCISYQGGTPSKSTQIPPCAPASSYFWLNSLHPVFTVHDALARAISTVISA